MADAKVTNWPKISMQETKRILTAPGAPFELVDDVVCGLPMKVYKNTLHDMRVLFDMGRAWGAREFIIYEDERLTYENHYRAVTAFARVLRDRYGIAKGDRVVLAMRNYPEWSLTFWATLILGGVIVPLNAWGTGPELEYGIADSGAKVAVLDSERVERIKPHLHALKNLTGVIAVRTPHDQLGTATAIEALIGKPENYAQLPDEVLPSVAIEPDDNATIFYTSGTTGKPKGALGTHRNILTSLVSASFNAARAAVRRGQPIPVFDVSAPAKVPLVSVPLFHVTGCHAIFVPSYAAGFKLVLMYKWDVTRAMELIQRERVTNYGGVPSMAWQLLEAPDRAEYDLSSIESIGYGGAPSAPELVTQLQKNFPRAEPGTGYGMTETSAIAVQINTEDYISHPGAAGVFVPVCQTKVVDPDGREVPLGEIGELWMKGPLIVKGYWNKPEATAGAITDGWMHSGDLVKMDEDGFVYILDRAKDMLIRGGENIYCVEVEAALYAHSAIMDAAVVGIPHKVLGEEVGAVVQVAPGHSVTEAELKAHMSQTLASFKIPIRIDIRNEPLPRNANGKILKTVLREDMQKLISSAA